MTAALGRKQVSVAFLAVIGIAVAMGLLGPTNLRMKKAVYVPLPVYEIEAQSGAHRASLLNLRLGQPGVPVAPTPVDVDGDLLPDVAVSVNLVDVPGGIAVPPNTKILAPAIRVDRLLTAVALGQKSPPLRITANLRAVDVNGSAPALTFKFGYDTTKAGSIPGNFSAVLRGLTDGFDPLTVDVDTRGLVRSLDPGVTHYQGPLTLLAGYEHAGVAPQKTNVELAYAPFPSNVTVGVASLPGGGNRLTYAHGTQEAFTRGLLPEVDLTTTLHRISNNGADTTRVVGRIDRLPRSATLDIGEGEDSSGSMALTTKPDGRLPDVDVQLRQKSADRLLNVRAEIDGVPSRIEGEWALPEQENAKGKARLRFAAPAGIGAVEASVSDTDDTSVLSSFVPTESQFVNFQEVTGESAADSARLITGRVEGVSKVEFAQVARGFDASFASVVGGRPLQLHATVDNRKNSDDKTFIEASSLIRPLPSTIDVHVRRAGDDETAEPLSIVYDASTPVDVQAALEYHDDDADFAATCGGAETTCATVNLRNIPAHIETRVARSEIDGRDAVKVDVELPQPTGEAPDIVADVVHGPDSDDDAARPLVAHLDALGVPASMHAVFERGADATVEAARFTTARPIKVLAFSVANFLEANRPADVAPSLPIVGNGARVVARGRDGGGAVDFEAIGRLVEIGSFRYVNRDAFGLHTEVGGNTDLNVDLDIRNVENEDKRVDLVARALVRKVPAVLDICMRPDGQSTNPDDYDDDVSLRPCVAEQPFAPAVDFDKSPLSIGYRASDAIDHLEANVHVRERGNEPVFDHVTNGTFSADAVPQSLTAHVLQPRERTNPFVAQFDTGGFEPPRNVSFGFEDLFGDLQCKDPRVPRKGQHAVCASATLPQLPGELRLDYDPDKPVDNFSITTDRTIDVTDFELSSIERNAKKAAADVLVVEADIDDIPRSIKGTLHAPSLPEDAPATAKAPLAVDFEATPPIKAIDAHVRTYLGPNPFATDGPPAQRAGLPPVDATFDTLTLLQSGDALRTDIHLADFSGVGYRTGVDDDGFKYPSHVANLRFGAGRNVRAYIDAEDASGDTGDATQRADRVIADVTALNMPAGGLTACFRGAVPTQPVQEVVAASYCDAAAGDKAAFELAHKPGVGGPAVHAFFRSTSDSDAKVLSGRVDVASLPEKLRGAIGDGADGNETIDDDTTARVETLPDPVGTIDAHIATFDINDEGYTDTTRPFFRIGSGPGPFPVANTPGQQAAVAAANGRLEARLRLGPVGSQPGSQFKKLSLTNQPCPQPAGRSDYPAYPTDPAFPTTYTCAQIDVVPSGGADPMAISLVKDKADGQRIALHDAGLSDVPDHIQLTLADTSPLVPKAVDPNEPLRARCGTVARHGDDTDECLPPLLRFDAAGAPNAVLWGVLDAGRVGSIAGLPDVASTLAPNDFAIDATPSATGWSDGTNALGVRAKIARVGTDPKPAVRAATLLQLPESLTVHPVQSWDAEVSQAKQGDTPAKVGKGKDLRFGFVARKAGGAPVDGLGRLGILNVDEKGNQTLVTDVADAHLKLPNPDGSYDDERPASQIPGEFDVTLNLRKNQLFKQTFINVTGRVNKATDLRVQMHNVADPLPEFNLANLPGLLNEPPAHGLRVDASILNLPGPAVGQADDGSPSFRLSTELLQPDEKGPSEAPAPPAECAGFWTDDGCTKTNVALVDIEAVFNFQPEHTLDPARYVRMVAQADGSTTGVHVQAFRSLTPAPNAVPDGVVTVLAALRMDPFNLVKDQQELKVFRITVKMKSSLMPVLLLDRVSEFRMRGKGPNISVQKVTGPGQATVVPFMFLDKLNVNAELDVWLTTIPLLGVRYIGPDDGLVDIDFKPCEDEDPGYTNDDYFSQSMGFGLDPQLSSLFLFSTTPQGLVIPSGQTATVLIAPDGDLDPNFAINVLGFPVLPGGGLLISAFDGVALCDTVPQEALINAQHPGDPFPFPGHAVAGAPLSNDVDADAGPSNQIPQTLEVPTGQTMTLECGYVRFENIDIYGTLKSKPGCRTQVIARDVTVQGGVVSHGSIVGDGDLTIYADNFYLQSGADVTMHAGEFEVFAADRTLIFGTINADGASTTPAKTRFGGDVVGGGGGAHFGSGGADAFGNDGVEAFTSPCPGPLDPQLPGLCGDFDPRTHFTEGGSAGAGAQAPFGRGPGRGGGAVVVAGRNTTVTGTIRARGADATAGPFDRAAGGGGGGGIVLAADALVLETPDGLRPTLLASGGNGACGDNPDPSSSDQVGGGGGGGGIIKLVAGTLTGPAPSTPLGGRGATGCETSPGHQPLTGHPGAAGRVTTLSPGRSAVDKMENYWARVTGGTRVTLPVSAVVPPRGAANDFTLYVCAMTIDPPNGVDADPSEFATVFSQNASPGDDARPCGYFSGTSVPLRVAARAEFTDTLTLTKRSVEVNLPEGEYLVWTTVGSSTLDGQACPPLNATASQCTYEPVPPIADEAVGIDKTAPEITDPVVIGGERVVTDTLSDPHTTWTGSRDITITTSGRDQAELSELATFDCIELNERTGQVYLVGCRNDAAPHEYRLQSDGDGTRIIRPFAVDRAGNVTTLDHTVIYDTTPPGSQATINITPDPDGSNGWYHTPPNFTLVGSIDGTNRDGSPGAGHAIPAWAYRVDGGDERSCASLNFCTVTGEIPGRGVHRVHYTPIDRVKNRYVDDEDDATPSPMFTSIPIKVDAFAPTTALLTSPGAADGANNWFVTAPWVALLGTDKTDGSGFDGPGAGIFYTVNGAAERPYTAPFKLGVGDTTVCWRSVDVAGNTEATRCETFRVDTADPTVVINSTPAAPDAAGNGWFTLTPSFTTATSDATSGVNAGTLVVSIDGGPIFTPTGPISIPEGVHDVRARVADNAGRLSPVVGRSFRVDLSAPTVSHRVLPPDPAQAGWYRRLPRVALVANDGDANSGVDRIEYAIGGGPFRTYTGPFELAEGRASVRYRAVDRSGHVTPIATFGLRTDVTSPVAKALDPTPNPWVRKLALLGLGPKTARLNYSVSDARGPGILTETETRALKVVVLVHDALGNAVRRIDAGTVVVTPGVTKTGFVEWNGTDQSLTGFLGVGLYHYRVIVSDEAGNWSESGESKPIQILL